MIATLEEALGVIDDLRDEIEQLNGKIDDKENELLDMENDRDAWERRYKEVKDKISDLTYLMQYH